MSINRISRQVVPGNHQEVPIGQHSCDRLLKGTALMDVQEKNRYLVQTWGYCGMPADMQTKHTYQWLLTKNNVSSLYWQYHRVLGMHVHEAAHVNLDEWLDPKSAHYNKTLAASIFHYEAWAAKGKRVKVCIATDEMKRAVWKYGHDSQIILNSTFGLCNRWILCFRRVYRLPFFSSRRPQGASRRQLDTITASLPSSSLNEGRPSSVTRVAVSLHLKCGSPTRI
jgi:hypothetical protein